MPKNTTDFTKSTKNTTDFSLNQDYDDTKVTYNNSSLTYIDSNTLYSGVSITLSPIINKNQTDFTSTTKTTTDWTVS